MTNDELMHLRRRLKSGEYSGVDIMSAWLALDELVAARKDAERYRWLRENAGAWEVSKDTAEWTKFGTGEKFKPRVYFTAFGTGYGGMFLDDALDAAMAGANTELSRTA